MASDKPLSGPVDGTSSLSSFECHEISRLYKHLTRVRGGTGLSPAKLNVVTETLDKLQDKVGKIRSVVIKPSDEATLHESFYDLRDKLRRIEIVNSGIPDLCKLMAPLKRKKLAGFKPMILSGESPGVKASHIWSQLTFLRMRNCGITRLDASLHFIPYLEHFDISRNDISYLIHLQDCHNLKVVNASHNRIAVLSNLGWVVGGLRQLNLAHNWIESLDGIDKLSHLEKLDLSFNRIGDVHEALVLAKLKQLREVSLAGNAIATQPNYRLHVFSQLLHECSLDGRPLPLLDGCAISPRESYTIKASIFLPPETATGDTGEESLEGVGRPRGVLIGGSMVRGDDIPIHELDKIFEAEGARFRDGGQSDDSPIQQLQGDEIGTQNQMHFTSPTSRTTGGRLPGMKKRTRGVRIAVISDEDESTTAVDISSALDAMHKIGVNSPVGRRGSWGRNGGVVLSSAQSSADFTHSPTAIRCVASDNIDLDSITSPLSALSALSPEPPRVHTPTATGTDDSSTDPGGRSNDADEWARDRERRAKRRLDILSKFDERQSALSRSTSSQHAGDVLENSSGHSFAQRSPSRDSAERVNACEPVEDAQVGATHGTNKEEVQSEDDQATSEVICLTTNMHPSQPDSGDVDDTGKLDLAGTASTEVEVNLLDEEHDDSLEDTVVPVTHNAIAENVDLHHSIVDEETVDQDTAQICTPSTSVLPTDNSVHADALNKPTDGEIDVDTSELRHEIASQSSDSTIPPITQDVDSASVCRPRPDRPSALQDTTRTASPPVSPTRRSGIPVPVRKSRWGRNQATFLASDKPNSPSAEGATPRGSPIKGEGTSTVSRPPIVPVRPGYLHQQPAIHRAESATSSQMSSSPGSAGIDTLPTNSSSGSRDHGAFNPIAHLPRMASVDGTEISSVYSGDDPLGFSSNMNADVMRNYSSHKRATEEEAARFAAATRSGMKSPVPSYTGSVDLEHLSVSDNLESYFNEQVFGHGRPSGDAPYMRYEFTTDPRHCSSPRGDNEVYVDRPLKPERIVGFYREQCVEFGTADRRDRNIDGDVPGPEPMVFVLTDINFYVVLDNFSSVQKFADAPLPVLRRVHPLETLRSCTLYFGFQRCSLEFCDDDMDYMTRNRRSNDTPTSASYIIITRDKSRTHPIITAAPQHANALRLAREPPLSKVYLQNKDAQLLDAVSDMVHSVGGDESDIVHYQMLYQIWKQKPGIAVPRTFIITPRMFLLCDEDVSSRDVIIKLVDSVMIKDIHKVRPEDDPLKLSLIMKPAGMSFSKRKWRMLADTSMTMSRVLDEIRKALAEGEALMYSKFLSLFRNS